MKKRGQVTVFIILGLLVVSAVIGAYYVKDYVIKSKWERLKDYPVPDQAQGIKDYIDSCVREVGSEAVELAGSQAGFVNVKEDIAPIGELSIFSNSLYVFPKSKSKVPYWWYEKDNGILVEKVPELSEISNDIKNYIDLHLKECLGNFEGFEEIVTVGDVNSEVDIKKEEVLFSVEMPVHMEIKDFKFDFSGFYEKVDAPLKDLYEVAKKIFYKEKNDNFLEEKTIDFMIVYPEIPFSGTREGGQKIWLKEQVINDLKNILVNNIPQLVLRGTDYTLANEEDKYFVIDTSASKDVSVNFLFSDKWPFKLEVAPEENGLLISESVSKPLGKLQSLAESFVSLSTHHFVYDVKFPVLVILNKNDYTFQFALQVVIDNNEPRKNTLLLETIPDVSKKMCEVKKNKWTIYTLSEGNALDEVDVKFKCINHLCNIGTTKLNMYDDAVIEEKLPICVNGALIGSKEGYHFGKEIISTNEEGSINLELEPLRELTVDVLVQRAGSGNIKDDESVYITLNEEEKEYSTSIAYPDQNKIKLIPGDYKVSIIMVSNHDITIPSKTIQRCIEVPKKGVTGVFGQTEEVCTTYTIPKMSFDKTISGKADFDLTISNNNLKRNKVIFYVPYRKIKTFEDLQAGFEEVVHPEFK